MAGQDQSFSQSVSLRQEQTLSPQQIQSLDILAAPVLELQQRISQAVTENPVLEMTENEPELPEDFPKPDIGENDDLEEQLGRIVDLAASGAVGEDDSCFNGSDPDADERREFFFNSVPVGISMQEDLMTQLGLTGVSGKQRELAVAVIGGIDDSGYLRTHPADIATAENCTLDEVEKAVRLVQSFDPAGIGARNLQECLLLQLSPENPDHELLEKLIREHLEEIGRNHLPQIAKKLGVSMEKLTELIRCIRALRPIPGDAFSRKPPQYIIPEASVVPDGDGWKIISNEDASPKIHLSKTYLKMLEDPSTPEETKTYLRSKITGGKGLLHALEQRKNTISRITDIILSEQYDFFRDGISSLKPMTMQQVADKLGLHETTVSRALSGKYLQTPQGLFEYKYFFTAGFRTDSGSTVSSRSVKEIIREMIESEDSSSPLSDNTLTEMLMKRGLDVKRRTVAKYREELGIPSSHLRRKF